MPGSAPSCLASRTVSPRDWPRSRSRCAAGRAPAAKAAAQSAAKRRRCRRVHRPRAVLRRPGDLGRADLAGRPVHRLHQAVQGHAQHLGEDGRRSPSTRPSRSPPTRSGPSGSTSGAATASSSCTCRTRAATRTSTCTRSIRRPPPAAGRRRAGGAQPHRGQGRACAHLPGVEGRSGRDVRWPQRPRRRVARRLPPEDLHRRADAGAQEHRSDRRVGVRLEGPAAPRRPHHGQGRHRDPARRRRRVLEDLRVQRPSSRAGPVRFHKDGQRVYLETNKGDVRPVAAVAAGRGDRQGGARRSRPQGHAWISAARSSRTSPTS